jgi:hypothetical protein
MSQLHPPIFTTQLPKVHHVTLPLVLLIGHFPWDFLVKFYTHFLSLVIPKCPANPFSRPGCHWPYVTFQSARLFRPSIGRKAFHVTWFTHAVINQPTNQPKRLTKGGVRRMRETSSLARSNHSCVRNALLEMVNGALNWNWEFCLR